MQLGIETQIPDGLLAANALLAENSRQGVPTSTHTLHRGFEFAISSTVLGFQFRCSETASDPVVAPSNAPAPSACQVKTLNMINQQFGTNLSASNILPTSDPNPQANGGQVNTNFGVLSGLSAAQFNAISSGRYAPGGFWGFVTGYGSSLHVVGGPSKLDPTSMMFTNANVGGMYSAQFTAHIDSAWADNPIGAIIHWFIDVRGHGSHRQPC